MALDAPPASVFMMVRKSMTLVFGGGCDHDHPKGIIEERARRIATSRRAQKESRRWRVGGLNKTGQRGRERSSRPESRELGSLEDHRRFGEVHWIETTGLVYNKLEVLRYILVSSPIASFGRS